MNFLPDVYVTCEVCRGRRYNRETLDVRYQGKNISELLDATVEEALPLLENHPQIKQKLQTLYEVASATSNSASRRRRSRAARRRGSSWPKTFRGAPRAAPSTSWTARPRDCIS